MKELDFDELDRAVNTLMGDVPKSKPATPDDDVKVLTIQPTLSDNAPVPVNEITVPSTTATTPRTPATPAVRSTASAPSVATRRPGRFMDVVHPSSDMKSAVNVPQRPISRSGATIQPVAAVEPTPAATTQPVKSMVSTKAAPKKVSAGTSTPVDSVVTQLDEPSTDWPDPIEGYDVEPSTGDVKEPDTTPDVTPAQPQAVEATEKSVREEDESDEDNELFTFDSSEIESEPQPLVSPFLTDTKVEKRPLGGSTEVIEPSQAPVNPAAVTDDSLNSNPDDQLPADPTASLEPTLPAELHSELVAIESDTIDSSALTQTTREAQPEALSPIGVSTKAAAAGPASIAQQYKESAATGDQSNGAIYDTDTYHQPLAHPVKKKSGWLWVVWVLLILLVGAGGGIALYLLEVI